MRKLKEEMGTAVSFVQTFRINKLMKVFLTGALLGVSSFSLQFIAAAASTVEKVADFQNGNTGQIRVVGFDVTPSANNIDSKSIYWLMAGRS